MSEIDRLRRSKKNLKEYDALKEELDKLRTRQHSLRLERDAIFQVRYYSSKNIKIFDNQEKNSTSLLKRQF